MPVTTTVSTEVLAVCDNLTCKRGQNGPTVVRYQLEPVQKGEAQEPAETRKFVTLLMKALGGRQLTACCPACAAEILGFPQPDMTQPAREGNLLHFPCRKPLDTGISPVNGQEGSDGVA